MPICNALQITCIKKIKSFQLEYIGIIKVLKQAGVVHDIDLMSCTTPACFRTFFSIYYGPYSIVELFSVHVC